MRKIMVMLCVLSLFTGYNLRAVGDTFIDYQNYNHGYCPECNYYPCQCDTGYCPNPNPCPTCPNGPPPPYPLDPPTCPPGSDSCAPPSGPYDACAPVGGGVCGVSICAIAVAIAAVVVAAAIIVGSSNGAN